MKLLAAYVMRGRMQAVVVTAVTALLALILPPLSYVSGGAVALVTLRVGPRPGLVVIASATLAVAFLGTVVFGTAVMGGIYALALWLPLWLLGIRLRRTVDLARTLRLAAGFGVALVLAVYATTTDPAGWWVDTLAEFIAESGIPPVEREVLADLAGLMTGLTAMALTLGLVGSLLLGRWWQALLFNAGGFRSEFHALRLGRAAAYFAFALLIVASLPLATLQAIALELAVVAVALFAVQGLAIAHGLVGATGASKGWLVAVYALLLLMLPQTALTLAVAGLADNWFDFRGHFGRRNES